VASVVGALPPGEATGALAVRLLLSADAAEDPARRVAGIGAATLLRVEVFEQVLARADPAVRQEVLAWVAAREKGWSEVERPRLARALDPLLASEEGAVLAAAVRGVGILGLAGRSGRLADLLGHPDPGVRAAAAHALSRVEREEEAEGRARAALPALLRDPDLAVRTGARYLAESVLGRALAFDPAADPASREASLQGLGLTPGE
jgi:hypothetical protein